MMLSRHSVFSITAKYTSPNSFDCLPELLDASALILNMAGVTCSGAQCEKVPIYSPIPRNWEITVLQHMCMFVWTMYKVHRLVNFKFQKLKLNG